MAGESVENYGDTGGHYARRNGDENESSTEAAPYAYAGAAR
nr:MULTISPECIES: hypothetical protein [unclassified Rhodococcus (in: high G+C Gram-positive bacteria)]